MHFEWFEYFLTASFNINSMIHFVFAQEVSYGHLDLAAVEAVLLPSRKLGLSGIHSKLYVQQ